MADQLARGVAHLASRLKAHGSVTIVIRRGPLSVSLSATLADSLLRTSDRAGNTKIERTDRDFIFTAADLILGGVVVTPERGDKVDVTFGSTVSRYEIMAFGGGTEPHWRYEDNHNILIRVHTKFVGNV